MVGEGEMKTKINEEKGEKIERREEGKLHPKRGKTPKINIKVWEGEEDIEMYNIYP